MYQLAKGAEEGYQPIKGIIDEEYQLTKETDEVYQPTNCTS
jgi:hypothetical protein